METERKGARTENPSPLHLFVCVCVIIIIKKRLRTYNIHTIYTRHLVNGRPVATRQKQERYTARVAVGGDALVDTERVCSVWIASVFFTLSFVRRCPGDDGWVGGSAAARSSRWRLNGGLDLGGRPLPLPPARVLADEGAVLVELGVLVAVVHQAVLAAAGFDRSGMT